MGTNVQPETTYYNYRESEIKHGRFAMTAFLAIFFEEADRGALLKQVGVAGASGPGRVFFAEQGNGRQLLDGGIRQGPLPRRSGFRSSRFGGRRQERVAQHRDELWPPCDDWGYEFPLQGVRGEGPLHRCQDPLRLTNLTSIQILNA